MLADDLPTLYAFDRWANARIFDACRKLSDADYRREPVPGWGSIHSSLHHLAGAAVLWAARFEGNFQAPFPPESDVPDIDAAARMLEEGISRIEKIIAACSAEDLAAVRTVRRVEGEPNALPFWIALRHVVNHATYHRGQIASKLKRLGVEPPSTDLARWGYDHSHEYL